MNKLTGNDGGNWTQIRTAIGDLLGGGLGAVAAGPSWAEEVFDRF